MSWPKYIEQLDYIKSVTEMLNTGPNTTNDIGYHIHVELRENDTFRKVGEWSDEIAPDCWSYEDKEHIESQAPSTLPTEHQGRAGLNLHL